MSSFEMKQVIKVKQKNILGIKKKITKKKKEETKGRQRKEVPASLLNN
jgi:hypothetical protein